MTLNELGYCKDMHSFSLFERAEGTYKLFKLDFKIMNIARNKEGLFLMMKKPSSLEDVTILNVCAPNNTVSKDEVQT